jgi:hypothetical protein
MNQLVPGRQKPAKGYSKIHFVFGLKHKASGKLWIARTKQTPKERIYEEVQTTNNKKYGIEARYKRTPLREAIIADGFNAFEIVHFATSVDSETARSTKHMLIKQFKTKKSDFGYN